MNSRHGRGSRAPSFDLPELGPGITLLDVDGDLGVTPMQAMVLDRTITQSGEVFWVDAGGRAAKTVRLRELAPHMGHLERIQVVRSFNVWEQFALVGRLQGRLEERVDENPPAAIVATNFDYPFREDDVHEETATKWMLRRLALLARLSREWDVPVLLTRTRVDNFSAPLENAAATHLQCEATRFGPRFVDVDDQEQETLVYNLGNGWVQTTIKFWQEVLEHRAKMSEASTTAPTASTPAGWD